MQITLMFFVFHFIITLQFSSVSCKGLGGIHLKMTTYDNPPYEKLKLNPDGNYTSVGPTAKIHEWLAEKLNYTYSIVDPVVDKVLIAKFNMYELVFAKLTNKEVDGLLGSLIINPNRAERMDFTSMVWTEPYTLVARKPRQESRLFAFIRPFQPTVWLFLVISVIVVIIFMSYFSLIFVGDMRCIFFKNETENQSSRNHPLTSTLSFYVIYTINILTNHGIYTPFFQHSFRILAAGWLLAALVLVNSYSSTVVSSLTVPLMEPPINTFEDVAKSKDVSIILHKNIILSQVILSATSGVYKTLGDQARQNPDEQLKVDLPSLIESLETGHFAYPFIKSFNRNFVVQQYKKDGKCRFQLSPPLEISTGYFSLVFQKKFPHTETISLGLNYLWETGLTRYWMEHEMDNAYKCFDKNQQSKKSIHQVAPIKMVDLTSAFLILGIGLGLGVFVFLVELILKFNYRAKRRQRVRITEM